MTGNTDFNEPTIKLDGPVKPRIPDINIEAKIGEGGMGVVYRGRQPYLDRLVAIKVLPALMTQNPRFVERFQREAKILAGLNHPNIVGCYQAGQTEKGECYLAMEFIDGPNLRQWISKNGPQDELHALELARCLLQALSYAHEHEIIHRDVKPENVLLQKLTEKESRDAKFPFKAKLVDLGLARPSTKDTGATRDMNLTVEGTVMGTPSTMAPEQFDDPDNVDYRADIYGLGCVVYHALVGEAAFPEQAVTQIIKRKSMGDVPSPRKKKPELRPDVDRFVTDMLQTRREDRPAYKDLIVRCEKLLKGANSGIQPAVGNASNLAPGAKTPAPAGVVVTVVAPKSSGGKIAFFAVLMLVVIGVAVWVIKANMDAEKRANDALNIGLSGPPPGSNPLANPVKPVPLTPTAPVDYSTVPVEAAVTEQPVFYTAESKSLFSADVRLKGWKSMPEQAWSADDDNDAGVVGNEISRAEYPWTKTPFNLEGEVVLYALEDGALKPRANQAGVFVQFDDGRCLALALSALETSTLATVERYDVGGPGLPKPQTPPLKHAARKTAVFPGVLTLGKTDKAIQFVVAVQTKTVHVEVNGQLLAEATLLPAKITAIGLYVNGTPLQTASFRNLRIHEAAPGK